MYANANDIMIIGVGSLVIGYMIAHYNNKNESVPKTDSTKVSQEDFRNGTRVEKMKDDDWIKNIPKTNQKVFFEIGHEEYLKNPFVGRIEIELDFTIVPLTSYNIYELCRLNKYKNCIFHRIISDFMIQTGDITNNDGTGGTSVYGENFNDENFTLTHDEIGTVAMANSGTRINPKTNEVTGTNSSQFYITLGPAPHLDGKHVVFGKVTSGINIVREVGREMTDSEDRPTRKIYIINSGIV
jgi:cyclophilin family peptidyl-prolyl cis-trans isomerase